MSSVFVKEYDTGMEKPADYALSRGFVAYGVEL
jgi:hypothetical protein